MHGHQSGCWLVDGQPIRVRVEPQPTRGAGIAARELDRLANEDDPLGTRTGLEQRAVRFFVKPFRTGVIRMERFLAMRIGVEVDIEAVCLGPVDDRVEVVLPPCDCGPGLRLTFSSGVRFTSEAKTRIASIPW